MMSSDFAGKDCGKRRTKITKTNLLVTFDNCGRYIERAVLFQWSMGLKWKRQNPYIFEFEGRIDSQVAKSDGSDRILMQPLITAFVSSSIGEAKCTNCLPSSPIVFGSLVSSVTSSHAGLGLSESNIL
jgi:hypothetical protein